MAPLFCAKCAADSAVIEPDAARAPDPTACRVLGASLYFSARIRSGMPKALLGRAFREFGSIGDEVDIRVDQPERGGAASRRPPLPATLRAPLVEEGPVWSGSARARNARSRYARARAWNTWSRYAGSRRPSGTGKARDGDGRRRLRRRNAGAKA